jgi:hypothetical protein
MCTLHFKCPVRLTLTAVGEVRDIVVVFSNHVCYNTQAIHKFQVMYFIYATLVTPRFLKWPEGFGKFVAYM